MENNHVLNRSEIEDKYKWDIDSLYSGKDDVLNNIKKLREMLSEIKNYKGKIAESDKILAEFYEKLEKASRLAERIIVYTCMKRDEDNSNIGGQEIADIGSKAAVEFNSAVSFVEPEIIAAGKEKIESYIEKNEKLKPYKHYFENILRQGEHCLSSSEEKIVAETGEMANGMENAFKMLDMVDLKIPSVKDSNGNDIEVTVNNFTKLLTSEDRVLRKNAFDTYYGKYNEFKNTYGALLSGSNKNDLFYAKVKGFNTVLEKGLFSDNIPEKVYYNVVDTITKNLNVLDEYCKVKKECLGVSKLHMYDLYAPMVNDVESDYDFETGKKMVLEGLSVLGSEYTDILKQAFTNRWIDVYENKGKYSGAYSSGVYDTKPYILLNYTNKLDDVLTMAHELGHSVHTYMSNHNQPYFYSQYTIFCAEIASTTNECLMYLYLMNKLKGKERKYIINQFMELIRTTYYRQAMFAEFELKTHTTVESGDALNGEKLSKIWKELNEKYYGRECVVDDAISIEWARIPHFYDAYYVYKYVTGLSAGISFAKRITEDSSNIDRYFKFLRSGCSDYSIEILKRAGVDMTTSKPLDDVAEMFKYLLAEFRK